MFRVVHLGLILLTGSMVLSTIGCGSGSSSQTASEELFQHGSLGDVGALYESYFLDFKKPPAKLADVAKYEAGMPTGFLELKQGKIVALWGGTLSKDNAHKVFAYEKATPESGGYVLMGDGKTIDKMSAEEFKATPKLVEIPDATKP